MPPAGAAFRRYADYPAGPAGLPWRPIRGWPEAHLPIMCAIEPKPTEEAAMQSQKSMGVETTIMDRRSFLKTTGAAGLTLAAGPLALSSPALAQRAAWPQSLVLGTASVGGTFFVYGGGWAAMVSEIIKHPISTQQTQGPNQNIILVQNKQVHLGMTTMGVALQAWNGTEQWTQGKKFQDIRAIFPMYDTSFHFVVLKKSGITKVADLKGKNVGVGPRAGTPGTYFPLFFKALGIDVTIRYGGASDMGGQLADGLIDCFAFAAGIPIAAFSELDASQDVRFITFTADEVAALKKAHPELSDSLIPKATYKSMTEDHKTVGVFNFAIAHKDLPEDLIYEIVKAVLDNNDRMVKIHAAAVETIWQNWDKNTFLPFHKGAAKYFAEKGAKIPANLIG